MTTDVTLDLLTPSYFVSLEQVYPHCSCWYLLCHYHQFTYTLLFSISPTGLSSGAVVGICFAVLIIILAAGLAGFFFYKQQMAPKSPDIVGLQSTGFDNVLYSTNQGVNLDSKSDLPSSPGGTDA